MRYFFIVFTLFLFVGCSQHATKPDIKKSAAKPLEIYDLVNIPQDAEYFSKFIDNNNTIYDIQKKIQY